MAKLRVIERIRRKIANSNQAVFLRKEFAAMASPAQVSQALSELVGEGYLVKAGYGLYVKTKTSSLTQNKVPGATLDEIVATFMQKKNLELIPGKSARAYNAGQTTQIPANLVLYTGKSRITRKISLNNKVVIYEKTLA